ncbi:AsnC family transcriptional regulator [Vibrio sp. MACH09]|uniref:Lrp/AsnC family transcriptional regulator n=1 Tax=unclassified Vibrio TaxID=2614977 RepID=UPI00149349A5|nr:MULTISPECIES: Lrp/AsnC family transcriptional regulator [unclassified Vibrio]NOI65403.1 Lrp/AsnC family transcriptional regulator [Vibrio sp. 99-8-1]GLO60581.1 AsnC family transcriptional regulator [Vibrio sp. MACH09]
MNTPNSLDNFDREILITLQEDNKTPLRVLADKVCLSAASVQRRIKKMEDDGVICANTAVVDPEKVGQLITIIVEVHIERSHTSDIEKLKESFSGPAIQQCYYVTGEADFILVLGVSSMVEYEMISKGLFYNNKNVKWFRTIIAMDRVKTTLHQSIK